MSAKQREGDDVSLRVRRIESGNGNIRQIVRFGPSACVFQRERKRAVRSCLAETPRMAKRIGQGAVQIVIIIGFGQLLLRKTDRLFPAPQPSQGRKHARPSDMVPGVVLVPRPAKDQRLLELPRVEVVMSKDISQRRLQWALDLLCKHSCCVVNSGCCSRGLELAIDYLDQRASFFVR